MSDFGFKPIPLDLHSAAPGTYGTLNNTFCNRLVQGNSTYISTAPTITKNEKGMIHISPNDGSGLHQVFDPRSGTWHSYSGFG